MTDNEIIKALKLCSTDVRENTCPKCAFYKKHRCSTLMLNAASDLINRQKAEVERLQKENEVMKTNCNSMCMSMPNMAKAERAEAIKEFAKRFVNEKCAYCTVDTDEMVFFKKDIDNLVKEMTEVEE